MDPSKSTILVVGGAGFVGSVVSHLLLAQGYHVHVFDRLMYGGRSLLGLYGRNFTFTNGDVRDSAAVERALRGVSGVVHLAAIVGDPACARQPELAREVNLQASLQLFQFSAKHGVERFIFASTCSNYGKMSDIDGFVNENSTLAPVSLYAETKVAVEKALLSHPRDRNPAVTVLRFATVFGLSPRPRFDLTVNEFAMELLVRRKLVVFGEQFWRPYIHVRDAARCVALVLESPLDKVRGEVFNVGDSTQNFQKKGIIELVRAEIDGPVEIQRVHKQEDPRDYRVCFAKVQQALGFHITTTVQDGIREITSAIRQNVITDFDNPCYRN